VWEILVCGGEERLKDAVGRKLHPTQKPEELLRRIILASSQPGDVVLDPFVGSGTTTAVAKQLRRHWIGIEREDAYVQAAQSRMNSVREVGLDHPWITSFVQEKAERIPFKLLLDKGYLRPGQQLFLDHSDHKATILPDGRLQVNGSMGSIHQIGARLKEIPSCNGWIHWYYQDSETGQIQPLNVLREKIRQSLNRGEGK
jgi:modification methylase